MTYVIPIQTHKRPSTNIPSFLPATVEYRGGEEVGRRWGGAEGGAGKNSKAEKMSFVDLMRNRSCTLS